jgi:hypothetical protein
MFIVCPGSGCVDAATVGSFAEPGTADLAVEFNCHDEDP